MARLSYPDIHELLEQGYDTYCRPEFIVDDPISIPHQFADMRDREISGLIAATIAWGQRPTIVRNAEHAMQLMGHEPYRFVMEHSAHDLEQLKGFVHRTFQAEDLVHFIKALRHIYGHYDSLEDVLLEGMGHASGPMFGALAHFKHVFFCIPHQQRTRKHVSDPAKGSSAKRLNMYLRWMVRDDGRGVDLGLWKRISPALLSCPLDVHSGRVARQLGLLLRPQDDWRAVQELDAALRLHDPADPVKYDFALFGIGVMQGK